MSKRMTESQIVAVLKEVGMPGDYTDISVTGMSGADLFKDAVNSGSLERVNLYNSGAVHVDQKMLVRELSFTNSG